MKNNTLVNEILRGEWLLHDALNYVKIAENLRDRLDLDFLTKHDKEVSMLSILDSFGNRIESKEGSVIVPKNSIAQVNMRGEIFMYSDWCVAGADQIVSELFRAQEISNVDATIMSFDTPGGSAKAIDTFRYFGKYKTKPIVGLVSDALSLGYWAACEVCDYIMMNGDIASRVGSIGATVVFRDNTKYLKDNGIETHEILPPESPFKNKDYTDARDKKDYKGIIENALSPLAIAFQNGVKEARPNLKQDEEGILGGKVYFAKDAVRLGLADGIGDIRMAIAKAKELAALYAVNSI